MSGNISLFFFSTTKNGICFHTTAKSYLQHFSLFTPWCFTTKLKRKFVFVWICWLVVVVSHFPNSHIQRLFVSDSINLHQTYNAYLNWPRSVNCCAFWPAFGCCVQPKTERKDLLDVSDIFLCITPFSSCLVWKDKKSWKMFS